MLTDATRYVNTSIHGLGALTACIEATTTHVGASSCAMEVIL